MVRKITPEEKSILMGFNPFRSHSKKEQVRQNLMKTNKPSSKKKDDLNSAIAKAAISTYLPSKSLSELEDALNRLTEMMGRWSKYEILSGALNHWPNPMRVYNHGDTMYTDVDTRQYQFSISTLTEMWSSHPVPSFIERHFNEAEEVDYIAIYDRLKGYPPFDVMTLDVLMSMIFEYFNVSYPDPDPNPFYSFNGFTMEQKDYYLPGLKVLNLDTDGVFWSPVFGSKWENNELTAEHHKQRYSLTGMTVDHTDFSAAMQFCDCGIYASVNMQELRQYIQTPDGAQVSMGLDTRFARDSRRLCIIEPFSDATVWMARKGWKASRAFISEIVGETISLRDAAELLSMVWKRKLDLESLYTNPEPK